jgi:hypothetical protein
VSKQQGGTTKLDPIIAVEVNLVDGGDVEWSEPVDIVYNNSSVVVASGDRIIREITTIRDVFVLHEKGGIEWIEGPLNGNEFAAILSNFDWRDEL